MNKRAFLLTALLVAAITTGYVLSNYMGDGRLFGREEQTVLQRESMKRRPGSESVKAARHFIGVLYYPDETAEKLVAEKRDMGTRKPSPEEMLQALARKPETPGLVPALPSSAGAHVVSVKDGVATVDFEPEIRHIGGGSTGEVMTVYSVVQTLTRLEGVSSVKFLVDGEAIDTLYGHLDLSVPVEPDPSLVTSSGL